MDDHFWMYWYLPQRLSREDCCKGVGGFINFALLNSKNISGGKIKCSHGKVKKLYQLDIVIMYLLKKGFAEKYLCWFAHWET